jgi:hypothetical protein
MYYPTVVTFVIYHISRLLSTNWGVVLIVVVIKESREFREYSEFREFREFREFSESP